MTSDQKLQTVFEKWNSFKGKGWKGHNSLNKPARDALLKRFREGYKVESLCKAIDNYAKVLLSPDYKWSYAWSLSKFFSVHIIKGSKWEGFQFTRFLDGEFYDEDYLTRPATLKRIEKERVQVEKPKFTPVSAEKKAEIRAKYDGIFRIKRTN